MFIGPNISYTYQISPRVETCLCVAPLLFSDAGVRDVESLQTHLRLHYFFKGPHLRRVIMHLTVIVAVVNFMTITEETNIS